MHEHGNHITHSAEEEQIALLSYMISHNKSHTDEIREVARATETTAQGASELLNDAISLYDAGTEKLAEALSIIKER